MNKQLSVLLKQECKFDPIISGVTSDSRSVRKGFLFVAVAGVRSDGRSYIADAIQHGAVAIVTTNDTKKPAIEGVLWDDIAWIETENPRKILALAASEFYHHQPETIFAVTGTNGKTSTVSFVRQILNLLGFRAVSLGTLGVEGIELSSKAGSMTTPDSVELHAQLADLAAANITHVAMEASSHGLDQFRLDGLKIFAAGFTNLTHDHLDYHGTMEHYRNAKERLFRDVLRADGIAVVNADIPEFKGISEICTARNIPIISYGRQADDLKILTLNAVNHGTHIKLNLCGQVIDLVLPFVGEFQIYNILCAVGLVLARCPKKLQEIIDCLPKLEGVKGRLQLVNPTMMNKPAVFVDYAHTPDALQNILSALRPHVSENGKLICVFGCGGDRDKSKRPIMGRIASELSDSVIITDDNPRSEDPELIRASIVEGSKRAENIGGRRNAIRHAIQTARSQDIVVIAGKGHEQGQIIGDVIEPFDDVVESLAALSA